ncbi:unnamed protein product [Victoria cruziana]
MHRRLLALDQMRRKVVSHKGSQCMQSSEFQDQLITSSRNKYDMHNLITSSKKPESTAPQKRPQPALESAAENQIVVIQSEEGQRILVAE